MKTRLSGLPWAACFLLFVAGCASTSSTHATTSSTSASATATAPESTRAPGYVRELPAVEFRDYLDRNPDAFVLDVRLPAEWNDDMGHLDRAVQIPLQELENRLAELPPDHSRPVAIYCRIGIRSATAAQIVAQHGYQEVVTLQGGLEAYRRAGY
jgi:rhodanese-related sulfurtransferase